jgi:hypothetical protein
MAYDEYLAERVGRHLDQSKVNFIAKKMMGGLCYMVDDKMLCGLLTDKASGQAMLMARIGEDAYADALQKKHCLPMDFTGRPMKGYVFIQSDGIDMDEDLAYWLDLCLAFNPLAKSSKKKKKS